MNLDTARRVLDVIVDQWRGTSRLSRFNETWHSYEEWLNWEAYFACREAGLNAWPKAQYRACGFKPTNALADLLVEVPGGSKLVIEVALVHGWTQTRWMQKLEQDRIKLRPPHGPGFMPLQVVIVTEGLNSEWGRERPAWLDRVSFWNDPEFHVSTLPLKPTGSAEVRAWIVTGA